MATPAAQVSVQTRPSEPIYVFGADMSGDFSQASAAAAARLYGADTEVGVGASGHAYAIPYRNSDGEVLSFGGCRMLLDVTNLLTHTTNRGGSPADFLAQLPLDRVVQVHFSGSHDSSGRLVESHAQPVSEAIWKLLDDAVARAPVRCICLERDDNLPPLAEVLWEVERARAIGRHHRRWN